MQIASQLAVASEALDREKSRNDGLKESIAEYQAKQREMVADMARREETDKQIRETRAQEDQKAKIEMTQLRKEARTERKNAEKAMQERDAEAEEKALLGRRLAQATEQKAAQEEAGGSQATR